LKLSAQVNRVQKIELLFFYFCQKKSDQSTMEIFSGC
jgi:hypothetical protein